MTYILTTVTNGVSFSLVAGAVCAVKFSNSLGKDYDNGVQVTLNISSTGAKGVGLKNWSNSNLYHGKSPNQYHTVSAGTVIMIYDGSIYRHGLPGGYVDYTD